MREIIRKVLLENDYLRRREFAKKTLFKLWDREKSMGKQPVINDDATAAEGGQTEVQPAVGNNDSDEGRVVEALLQIESKCSFLFS